MKSVSGQLKLYCTECHFINLIEPAVNLALYMPKQGVREGIFLETSQTEES